MIDKSLVELAEKSALARAGIPIAREYIEEAIMLIESGEEEVVRYPSGQPSLKGIYEIAARLESVAAVRN